MLLTGASFLSKFLGLIYLIPFNALVGEAGGTLYGFAYTPYSIFISFATIGFPVAVSKFVSKYNSLGDYQTGMRMFRIGTVIMAGTGLLAFLIMFFSADLLANLMISNEDPNSITSADVAFVIRMVSIALLIIPSMSIIRGFFQGYESMGPTAVSQVVEQIVRIGFILIGAYVIIHWLNGSVVTAVGFSTFAAFIGAVASLIILLLYFKKRKPYLQANVRKQTHTYDLSNKELITELFSYAGPFIIVGLAIPLFQLIDQFTFERAMTASGRGDVWVTAYSAINVYGHKIVIIPMTVATGLSITLLPTLTKSFTQNSLRLVHKQIHQALQIVLVVVIPAAAGIAILSYEAYGTLYGLGNLEVTGALLAWYAPVALLFALFSVTAMTLQGISQQRFAVLSLLIGLLVKILFNSQLIHMFGAKGAIFGTAAGLGIAVILNLHRLKKMIDFKFKQTIKRTMLILIFTLVMGVVVWLSVTLFGLFIPNDTRVGLTLLLIIGVGGGAAIYLWLSYSSGLLEHIFNGRVPIIDKVVEKISGKRERM